MINNRARPLGERQILSRRRRVAAMTILAATFGAVAVPASGLAAGKSLHAAPVYGRPALKTVSYRGVHLKVPAGWPVIRLGANSRVCVRFDRHAVYVGTPGTDQLCPLKAVGRTEAILMSPEAGGSSTAVGGRGVLTAVSTAEAGPDGGSMARFVRQTQRVVITVTWDREPKEIRTALGVRSLRDASRATNGHKPLASRELVHARAVAKAVSATSPATPGEVFSGLGFDACTAPSTSALSAWGSASPFGAVGVYIGGANMACSQTNLTASWVTAESAAGWHLIPIYVGLQAPSDSCNCSTISPTQASVEGTAAAQDAVAQAQALAIGTGNPIYFDMEGYTRTTATTAAVLGFLEAWTEQLHASGYESGVYSSAASGISDLVTEAGTGYVEPDEIWTADWNGQQTTVDSYVPATDWSNNQRLHQYAGAETETYGGVSINIDSDYLDGATAAAGTAAALPPAPTVAAAPSLVVSAHGNGEVALAPQWTGEPGISQFQILAGDSASEMTPIETFSTAQTFPVVLRDIYTYFEVQALNASGGVLGTSPAARAPARVAVFSNTAFVSPRGKVGIPVACMNAAPCKVRTVIYNGKKRIASAAAESVSRHGGMVHLALGPRVNRMLVNAPKHELSVTANVTNGAGTTSKAAVDLIAYSTSGRGPKTGGGMNNMLQVLGTTELVSDGWVGEVLVACTASTPCKTTLRVAIASGKVIARGKTPTIGAGEIAELHFQMTAKGHALLKVSPGNQLSASVVVSATLAGEPDAAASVAGPAVTTARVSLTSY